jgi:hypothetical protein
MATIEFYQLWTARGKVGAARVGFLARVSYALARFRAARVARIQARCSHEVIGDDCAICGWPFRLLNVYTPPGLKVARPFLVLLRRELPPGVRVVTVEGQAAHLGIVGFELPPLLFMRLQSALQQNLEIAA